MSKKLKLKKKIIQIKKNIQIISIHFSDVTRSACPKSRGETETNL